MGIDDPVNMQQRSQRVLIETSRYRITGLVTLPRDGYRSRLSDFLNSSERDFISVTEVSIQMLDTDGRPGDAVAREFIVVARGHIVLATALDEPAAS